MTARCRSHWSLSILYLSRYSSLIKGPIRVGKSRNISTNEKNCVFSPIRTESEPIPRLLLLTTAEGWFDFQGVKSG